MAEVIAGVSSVVGIAGFALQLTETVIKLKEFCSKVYNAPSELTDSLECLEDLTETMDRIAAVPPRASNLDHTFLQKSVARCRKAQGRIVDITNDLQASMQSKKLRTSLEFVLKEAELTRLQRRVDQAKNDLYHAHQTFILAQVQSDHDSHRQSFAHWQADFEQQAQRFQQHYSATRQELLAGQAVLGQQMLMAQSQTVQQMEAGQRQLLQQVQGLVTHPISACMTSDKASTSDGNQHVSTSWPRREPFMEHAIWSKKYRLRLFSQAWDVSVTQAMSGWTFSMRPYRIVGSDHPIFRMCADGDVAGVQRSLQCREASIYDRDEWGGSLFTEAVVSGATDVLRLLMNHGMSASVSAESRNRSYFAETIMWNVDDSKAHDFEALQIHAQYLVEDCEYDVEDGWFELLAKPLALWDVKDRLRVLLKLPQWLVANADFVSKILGQTTNIFPAAYLATRELGGKSLIHVIAESLSWSVRRSELPPEDRFRLSKPWGQVLGDGVRAGADLHVLWQDGFHAVTPLTLLFEEMFSTCFGPIDIELSTRLLQGWVKALSQAGVDLEQYGRVEAPRVRELLAGCWRGGIGDVLIVGFMSYGPYSEDWVLHERHLGDIYAGIFWDQVAHPERATPGSWVEDTDAGRLDDEESEYRQDVRLGRRKRYLCHRCGLEEAGLCYH